MSVHFRIALLALGATSAACSFPVNDKVAVPPPPSASEGLQFVMPDTVIPAGQERMTCWVPDYTPDQDHQVVSFEPLQGSYGHHMVAMVASTPRQAGSVFDCTDVEQMASLRPLILPDRDGEASLLPPGFAVKLPRGARIVFQSHHINTSERDLVEADVARMHFAPAGSNPTMAGYFILNSTQMNLAPHAPGQISVSCSPPQRLQALLFFGHMHFYGRSLSLTRDRGGTVDTIYSVDTWQPSFRDLAPVTSYPVANPLVLEPADTYTLTCHYENPTDGQVRFPSEMCTAISYYFPALPEALVLCE